MVQWLGLCPFAAEDLGSILGEARSCKPGLKVKENRKTNKLWDLQSRRIWTWSETEAYVLKFIMYINVSFSHSSIISHRSKWMMVKGGGDSFLVSLSVKENTKQLSSLTWTRMSAQMEVGVNTCSGSNPNQILILPISPGVLP